MNGRLLLTSLVSNVDLAIQKDGLKLLRQGSACDGGTIMLRIVSLSCAGFALLIGFYMSAGPANAVVYCKTEGVRVARPVAAAPVVAAPAAGRAVVYCKTRGVPKGCVMR